MKAILKSAATIAALSALVATSTGAWFTSSGVSADNVITTGTLAVSVDAAQDDTYVGTWGNPNAYTVIDNGVATADKFIPWTNAAPGDTNSYTMAIRNGSTLPFKYRAAITGDWVSGPNFGVGACPLLADANDALVTVTNVHQYAATAASGCENNIGCRNMRDGLQTGPWTTVAGLTAADVANPTGYYYGAVNGTGSSLASAVILDPGEFAVYRVDAELSDAADNCYQGATYNFDVMVDATQPLAPWF